MLPDSKWSACFRGLCDRLLRCFFVAGNERISSSLENMTCFLGAKVWKNTIKNQNFGKTRHCSTDKNSPCRFQENLHLSTPLQSDVIAVFSFSKHFTKSFLLECVRISNVTAIRTFSATKWESDTSNDDSQGTLHFWCSVVRDYRPSFDRCARSLYTPTTLTRN